MASLLETVLNLLLIRFALIVAGVVVLALLAFAAALVLRRRGGMDEVRRSVAPAARVLANHLDARDGRRRTLAPSRRRSLITAVISASARHLADDRDRSPRSGA